MLKQLTELKKARPILETPQSPRDSQIIPKISPNDSNNHHSELIVDLVSDSEIDSEAETVVDFAACSQIQVAWVYSLQTWEEAVNTSTNRSLTRIRILEDRILHLLERVDLRQFF